MVIERIFKDKVKTIHPALAWIITFTFINLTWVIFRADSLFDAIAIFKMIFKFNYLPLSTELINTIQCNGLFFLFDHIGYVGTYLNMIFPTLLVVVTLFIILFYKNTNEIVENFEPTLFSSIKTGLLLFYSTLSLAGGISTFLYFNF